MSGAIYQTGGTLASDHELYITRQADTELLELCRSHHFAYILAPRQIGKSSLMLRTAENLTAEGIQVIKLDLSRLGTQLTTEAWYYGLLYEVRSQLGLKVKLREWWSAQAELGITQRLVLFFEQVVLVEVTAPIVIFIDEIDTTLSLDFTDDFFAAIRSFYVNRTINPDLQRLAFVLIGVATPGDLIRDPKRTPFNIGKRVEMTDFSPEEALPLALGLDLPPERATEILGWILEWTGGHPYLTQKLCQALAEARHANLTRTIIATVVQATFLGDKSFQDNNLQFVRDMLIKRADHPTAVLTLYRQIQLDKRPVADEEQSLVKSHLKLSGIVKREGLNLKVRNQLYRAVFGQSWIKEHLPINWAARLRRAQGVIAASMLVTLLMVALALYAFAQQSLANERAREAEAARTLADRQRQAAEIQTLAFRSQTVLDPEVRLLLATVAAERLQQAGLEDGSGQVENTLRQAIQTYTPNLILSGHTDQVYSAAFSPDGKRVITAGWDKQAKLWDVSTGKELLSLTKHTNYLTGAVFSPDGKKVATTSLDGTTRVWDSTSGQELFSRSNWCNCFWVTPHFSPDGKRLLLSSYEGLGLILDASSGQELAVLLLGHQTQLNGILFSPNEKMILTTALSGSVMLWDATTYQLRYKLEGHREAVTGRFSPDNTKIVTNSTDGTARLWQSDNGQLIAALPGHAGAVNSAVFTADSKSVVTVGADGTIRIWDSASGKVQQTLRGHNGAVLEVISSPDGAEIVTAGADGTLKVWSMATGRELITLYGHSGTVAGAGQGQGLSFSPDGRWLLSAGEDGTARLWDWKKVVQERVSELVGHSADVDTAVFSPDGKYIVSASDDRTVRLWNAESGKEMAVLIQQMRAINSAVFSPDGRYLLTSAEDSTVRLWETGTGWQKSTIINAKNNSGNPVRGASFSADGSLVAASIFGDNITQVWSLNQPDKEPRSFSGGIGWGRIGQLFSQDNKRLVTFSLGSENEVWIWEVSSGKKLTTLVGHSALINSASFSADGRYLVTASQDGTVRVWDSNLGKELLLLRGHAGGVNSAVFSPNSRFIASAGKDETVRIWEVSSGKEIQKWHTHAGQVYTAGFSPDGKKIVSASADKTIQIFDCYQCGSFREIIQIGQTLASHPLSLEERRQFGLQP